jgi:hypothetical protein
MGSPASLRFNVPGRAHDVGRDVCAFTDSDVVEPHESRRILHEVGSLPSWQAELYPRSRCRRLIVGKPVHVPVQCRAGYPTRPPDLDGFDGAVPHEVVEGSPRNVEELGSALNTVEQLSVFISHVAISPIGGE